MIVANDVDHMRLPSVLTKASEADTEARRTFGGYNIAAHLAPEAVQVSQNEYLENQVSFSAFSKKTLWQMTMH